MNSSRRAALARFVRFAFTLVGMVLLVSAATVTAQGERSRIAFVTADYDTRQMTISLADPVSGQITPLVVDGNFFYPTLSPDGRHLAFLGEHPQSRRRNIYIIDTDGTNLHPVVPNRLTLKPNGQVVWSPDSSQVIYGILSGGPPADSCAPTATAAARKNASNSPTSPAISRKRGRPSRLMATASPSTSR